MEQILRNTPITVKFSVYNGGTLTDTDVLPSITAVDAAGTAVTVGAVSTSGTGVYQATISGQSDLKVITATLTGAIGGESVALVQVFEVVGAVLFTEAAFRAFNGSAMSSESSWSDDAIAAARTAVTDQLEHWTGRSWIPRYARAEFAGTGTYILDAAVGRYVSSSGDMLRRPGSFRDIRTVISANDGSAVTASNVISDGDGLIRTDGVWTAATTADPMNVTVEWEYGVTPHDGVDRVGMLLAADRLRVTAISDRASSFTDETGTLRFATPGRGGAVSSIPEVNEWVRAHDVRVAIA